MQKKYPGIDVSKLSFHLALMTVKKGVKESVLTTQFDNNVTGLKAFEAYLVEQAVTFDENTLLVFENRGIYHPPDLGVLQYSFAACLHW